MRRVLALGAAVLALGGGTFALTGASDGDDGAFRVDALFDNAGFLIPGQDVKIAGAKVGDVADVTLTDDKKARIEMRVDRRFAPFRTDARCTIQPQSLIGEKFIQCAPGTPEAPELRGRGDAPPTVPLARTSAPIDLDLVLATFRQPTTTRAALLLSALGGGLAGRSGDLSATIRRADPALAETNRLLRLVDADRETIKDLVADADAVATELDRRRGDVASFIRDARRATDVTAAQAGDLRATLRGVPGLLAEARPGLAELRRLGEDGAPVAARLADAAPAAERLVDALGPFATRTRPTLTRLGTAARDGDAALRTAAPQVRRLGRLALTAQPAGERTAALFGSMRDKGAVEGLQRFVYWATAALSRFDSVSHILPAYILLDGVCSIYATKPVESCDARFAASKGTPAVSRDAPRRGKAKAPAREERPAAAPQPAAPRPDAPAPAKPSLPQVLEELPQRLQDTVEDLLAPGSGALPKATEQLRDELEGLLRRGREGAAEQQAGLLDFLLGGGR